MKTLSTLIFSLFMSVCFTQLAYANTTIQAFVNNNTIVMGEQLILNISVNDIGSEYQLDSSPLTRNFRVFLPSQSRQRENINGKMSQKTTWKIRLQAKKTGKLQIPSLTVGPLKTQPIAIQVEIYSANKVNNTNNSVFMRNSLSKDNVYLGQTFILTSQVFLSKVSDNLELSMPTLDNASIEIYASDKSGSIIRNGIRYQTITRQYKITPHKAGKIAITPPYLSGTLRKIIHVNQWQNKILAVPINLQNEILNITVKAIPKDFKGEWIISDDLRLVENIDLTQKSYHVGEPITRSVTLKVASIDQDKLPSIDFNYSGSLRYYPDKDVFASQRDNVLSYATRTFKHAIIADKAGTLILPEIKIVWWNSQTDKQQVTLLAQQTLTILSANTSNITPRTTVVDTNLAMKTPPVNTSENVFNYWKISTLIFALLFSGTLLLLFLSLRVKKTKRATNMVSTPQTSAYLLLQKKLKKGNSTEVYQALLIYAQQRFPTLKSISQLPLMSQLSEQEKMQLRDILITLENACSHGNKTCATQYLSVLIQKIHDQQTHLATDDVLRLNPTEE
ncbi:hypothetical protein PCNPT3_09030 [Psychromonas sp. CNPT3]|uniref:BatD family protein n=1 Tax=Psychromonas sp. CNPT3 TaxID=314282 RepID=UPI00006E80F2|nr:BatD family protein [Psychromonas sp. CNPT3]AGH81744.1 hypothetical protein PCNPT3_09030 [Psychromonas sp. CNPT3]